VAVQTGEGTTDIIYGSASIPAGPRTYGGYLARPDGTGEWPTVIIYGPTDIPTSTIKNICRVFARHGIAAIAPEMGSDPESNRKVSMSIAGFIANPSGDWSNAEYGYGVVAFERGLEDAAALTASDGRVVACASVGSDLDDSTTVALGEAHVPCLFIASRADEGTDVDRSLEMRDRLPNTTFVIFGEGDRGFWNDDADGFSDDRYRDTIDRLIGFFGEHLPPRI
jgi:dienelactone hydrolase